MSHMTEHVGRVVGGRYRLLAPLGSGASAEVYLADDVRLRRRVAVKILRAVLADDEAFLRRFRAEARAAAALNHPSIVAIYDWNGDAAPPYLVTEYLSGGSLRSLLDAGHRLSPSQALLVGLEAAQALDHAHRQGLVHRDIKPANLLFGGEARLRIADFGLARAVAEAGWTEPSGAVLGTARYASPEQVRGESLDGRSDVYSLALVLIEAVTGTVPFSADTTIGTLMARLDRAIEVPESLDALVPLLTRAGQPQRDERPDAGTLVNDLVDAATQLPRPADLPLVGTTGGRRDGDDGADRTLLGRPAAPPGPPPGLPPPPGVNGDGARASGLPPPTRPDQAAPGAPGSRTPQDATAVVPLPAPPGHPSGPYPSAGPTLHPLPRFRRMRPWLVPGLAVFAALAVGIVGAWAFLSLRVPSHEVPATLIGAQRAEISDLVGEFGWRTKIEEVYRDGTVSGEVLETDPAPGTRLREGETLEVTVSLGPTLVTVPGNDQLAGLTEDQATGVLGAPGVELVAEFVPTASEDVDEGTVIGLEEGTPDRLSKGATVRVLVSSGPAGVRIPDMEGWDVGDALDELERLGLEVEFKTERSDDVSEGKVVRTDPGPDDEVDPGGSVTVVVSRDGRPSVPDLRGMSLDEATDALAANGLRVGDVSGNQSGEVFSSLPFSGTEVSPNERVDLLLL